jgi:hypothetical protein
VHVKLDVDGNELAILQGGAATLTAHVETLLVEIEDQQRSRSIREFLTSLGFVADQAFAAAGAHRNVLFRRAVR